MTKADTIFKENIERILKDGVFSEQARPKYKDGTVANSKYVTGAFAEYDLSMGEFPITRIVAILSLSGIIKLLRRQTVSFHAPFRPCLMSVE